MYIEVKFPKRYKPLPEGYKVVWSEESEMYLGINEEKDLESPIFCCRFMARRWCFNVKYPKFYRNDYKLPPVVLGVSALPE
jgi:hypothetical protein